MSYMTRLGIEIADAKMENPEYPGPIHPSVNSWVNMYVAMIETFNGLTIPANPDPIALHHILSKWGDELRQATMECME